MSEAISLDLIGKQLLAIQDEQRRLRVENEMMGNQISGLARVMTDQIIKSERRLLSQMSDIVRLIEAVAERLDGKP